MGDYFDKITKEELEESENIENSLRDSWEMAFRVILISGWSKTLATLKVFV